MFTSQHQNRETCGKILSWDMGSSLTRGSPWPVRVLGRTLTDTGPARLTFTRLVRLLESICPVYRQDTGLLPGGTSPHPRTLHVQRYPGSAGRPAGAPGYTGTSWKQSRPGTPPRPPPGGAPRRVLEEARWSRHNEQVVHLLDFGRGLQPHRAGDGRGPLPQRRAARPGACGGGRCLPGIARGKDRKGPGRGGCRSLQSAGPWSSGPRPQVDPGGSPVPE